MVRLSRLFVTRYLGGHPMATAVTYVVIGVLPLYLTSAQFVALERDLGFTTTRLGVATALYFGLAAAVASPVGRAVHRWGATAGLRTGAFISALASVVAVSAGVWWPLLVVGAGLAGVANAFMQVATNVVLAREAAFHRQGISFGAKQGAIPLASMLAGAMLPVLGVSVGWRWPFVLAALVAIMVSFIAPPVTTAVGTGTGTGAKGRTWSASPSLRWLTVGGACGGAAGNSLSLFLVPSAVAIGISEASAGTALAIGGAMVLGVRLLTGWIADRMGSSGHKEMVASLAVGTAGCAALALFDSPVMFLVGMAIALVGSWGWPGLVYLTVVRIHPEAPAQASGAVLSGNLTGSLIGPLVTGFLAGGGSYSSAWVFCAVLSLVATVSMTISRQMAKEMTPAVDLRPHLR